MKTEYKGYNIKVSRDSGYMGYPMLFYSISKDGREITSGYCEDDNSDNLREFTEYVKTMVDDFTG